jgi:hypothetical protein
MLLPCMTRMRRQGAERQQRRLIDRGARVEEGAWRLSSVASARDAAAAAARRCPPRNAAAAAAAVLSPRPSGQRERRDRRESSELTSGKTFRRSARERRLRLRAQRPSAAAAARHGTRRRCRFCCSSAAAPCVCSTASAAAAPAPALLMRRALALALFLLLRCRTPCPRRFRGDAHDMKRSRCRAFPRTNIRCGRSAALHELGLLAPSELALNRGLAARRQLGCRQTAAAAAIRGG